jgi:6-methylsalicylate decarboxylase
MPQEAYLGGSFTLSSTSMTLTRIGYGAMQLAGPQVWGQPNASPDPIAHTLGLPDNLIDFTTDTNRLVAEMHYTNRFARTPSVRYIFSHAGGSIPYMSARFAIIDEMGFVQGGDERGTAADMIRRMYWDTALSASDPVLQMLHDVAGAEQILFGTDFPYIRRDIGVKYKDRINNSKKLSDSEKGGVFGNNSIKLFPRLLSVRHSAAATS